MVVTKGIIYLLIAINANTAHTGVSVVERFETQASCQALADKLTAFSSWTKFRCFTTENLLIVGDQHAGK